MKSLRVFAVALLVLCSALPALRALEKQPSNAYHTRRVALAGKLQSGVAVLFAAEEPQLDFMPYRQDSDFYYLTGWTEPGAALLIVGDAPQAALAAHLQGDSVSAGAQSAHGKIYRRKDGRRDAGSRGSCGRRRSGTHDGVARGIEPADRRGPRARKEYVDAA